MRGGVVDLDPEGYYSDEVTDNASGVEVVGEDVEASGVSENRNGAGAEPWDAWLPLTESRNGNTVKAFFHLVCSGIGSQTLLLPVAMATLGWTWGILALTFAFAWQLYTIRILVHLHELPPSGTRYSRYLLLTIHAFGQKLGKLLGIFPVMYLSGGTCVMLIITGGGAMRTLFQIICGDADTCHAGSLAGAEWFLIFTCLAIAAAQLPNLNSVAGVSLLGAITAVAYCTVIWVSAVKSGRAGDVSYEPLIVDAGRSGWARACDALNAVGIMALAFRGHNLILEIQGTLPWNPRKPCKKPMWRAVTMSYALISLCFYPLAIAGFWAYGNKIPRGGMLSALSNHLDMQLTSKFQLGLINLLVILNTLCVFPLYSMVVFDNLEIRYTSITGSQRCSRRARTCLRLFFGGLAFFVSVALPFLGSLAPLIGGLALPLTYSYPCLMWVKIRKPRQGGTVWWINSGASG